MDFPTAIQQFTDYLKYQKRYSAHTIRSYHDDLAQFHAFVEKNFDDSPLENITSAYVRTWLASLKDDELASRSINRKISALKSFFKYHLRAGVLTATPMGQVSSPKAAKRLPVFVKQEETDTLFRHVEFTDDWKGRTDRLLIGLLYNAGLRSAELVSLKHSQVDASRRVIKVLGKGNKERIIPVSPALLQEIGEYLEGRREAGFETDCEQLLVTDKGKPLYAGYVYRTVKEYLGKVTSVNKKSPHVLRHTFATHLLNNGADLNSVKELLGHASLAATQVYTHHTIEKLKDVHRKAHPKA
jgi:integrase/recombinase XerC